MHLQLGGDLLLQTTETTWKHSYGSLQHCVTELNVRQLSPVTVMTAIANCSLVLPTTLNTCCMDLPPEREHHYTQSLRQLPDRTSVLTNQKLYSENVNSRLSLFLLTILTFVISCVTVFCLII